METSSLNQSPPLSDSVTGSWIQCWGVGEEYSLTGLNIEAANELNNLVEDREIAAKAVAFVVNSTRKGIVPLCADVATLLRTKHKLEQKVRHLRSENTVLRSTVSGSMPTSTSTSPALSSYGEQKRHPTKMRQIKSSAECFPPSSSQCSSQTWESPRYEKPSLHHSPRLRRTSAFSIPDLHSACYDDDIGHMTVAVVHEQQLEADAHPALRMKKHRRKKSLPEMISEPHETVQKISPRTSKISKEVQCELNTQLSPAEGMEAQFREALELNAQLTKELDSAKKEIEVLKGKLHEMEMRQLAARCICRDTFIVENEQSPGMLSSGSIATCSPAASSHCLLRHSCPMRCLVVSTFRHPLRLKPPLSQCKCCECISLSEKCSMVATKDVTVAVGDHVVVTGLKTGHVMYVGHIDGANDKHCIFVGLQLDAPVGCHDGMLENKRYFTCEKNCGMFVPLHEVIHVIEPDRKTSTNAASTDEVSANYGDRCQQHNRTETNEKLPKYYRNDTMALPKLSKVLTLSASDIV